MVPMKYRIYNLCKLSATCFVDIIGIDPEVLQVIISSLFSVESDLVKTSLIYPILIHYIPENNFLQSLYIREDNISGNIIEELY
jgi:hypothetical protein